MTKQSAPEFSVEINLGDLPRGGKLFHLKAGKAECAAIAKRLGVPAVKLLEGDIHLAATKTNISAVGTLRATLVRECVASLEEMDEAVSDSFELEFVRDESLVPEEEGVEEWELPEVHEGPVFDLGELLAQQLSLAMNPFPRKEGARSLVEDYGAARESSPFAALRQVSEKSEEKQ